MTSFNRVILAGNLTRDIELRTIDGGNAVAKMGIAVNRKYKTKSGEQREDVAFVDCEAWGRTAEVMAQYLEKGRPVLIEGRLKMDQWQDKEGNNRSKLLVIVEQFSFIDGPKEDTRGDEQPERRAPARQPKHEPMDDDIPF